MIPPPPPPPPPPPRDGADRPDCPGHGNAPHASERAVARFQELGIDVVPRSSDGTPHTPANSSTRRSTRGTDAFVVVGGDGVIPARAASAGARSGVPLGIVPAGTGNDHGPREIGCRRPIRKRAVDIIAAG